MQSDFVFGQFDAASDLADVPVHRIDVTDYEFCKGTAGGLECLPNVRSPGFFIKRNINAQILWIGFSRKHDLRSPQSIAHELLVTPPGNRDLFQMRQLPDRIPDRMGRFTTAIAQHSELI